MKSASRSRDSRDLRGNRKRSSALILEGLESRLMMTADPHVGIGFGITAASNQLPANSFSVSDIIYAYQANLISFTSTPGNGAGQTIAIVDAYKDPNIANDLNVFDSTYGISSVNTGNATFIVRNQYGTSTLPNTYAPANWALEQAVDVEAVHAMAPGANIILYEANSNSEADLAQAIRTARENGSVVVMNWG